MFYQCYLVKHAVLYALIINRTINNTTHFMSYSFSYIFDIILILFPMYIHFPPYMVRLLFLIAVSSSYVLSYPQVLHQLILHCLFDSFLHTLVPQNQTLKVLTHLPELFQNISLQFLSIFYLFFVFTLILLPFINAKPPTPAPLNTAVPAILPTNKGVLLYQRINALVVTSTPLIT